MYINGKQGFAVVVISLVHFIDSPSASFYFINAENSRCIYIFMPPLVSVGVGYTTHYLMLNFFISNRKKS